MITRPTKSSGRNHDHDDCGDGAVCHHNGLVPAVLGVAIYERDVAVGQYNLVIRRQLVGCKHNESNAHEIDDNQAEQQPLRALAQGTRKAHALRQCARYDLATVAAHIYFKT